MSLRRGESRLTGTVKELKERLNTLILQLKTRYASDQKRTDVLHLNKDITAFDAMCSASDDILLVSSNAQRQIYQVLVAKDGIGLVGSVSELVAYPEGTDKVISMTVNNGRLYFSSEGHGWGLFQVNLGSSLVSCLITTTEQCEVHGVAVFKEGIAFSDPKAHQLKHYSSSTGITVLAGDGKEGRGKGVPNLLTSCNQQLNCNLFVCDLQLGEISICNGVAGHMRVPFSSWKAVPIFPHPQETASTKTFGS